MSVIPTLSVVLPTYNCAALMARHLASMASWSCLAKEIIVVDSRSTDGTLDIIRDKLKHPNLRIIERDRGLYQSWNEGIAATTGDWVYISTAGDTIEKEHLHHLRSVGAAAQADVVISAPRFVDENGGSHPDLEWPPSEIIKKAGLGGPFLLTTRAGFALTFAYCPKAILGSSASNLYRGEHLRPRPFPTDFLGAGDSIWILRHASESRICFTNRIGSTFCVHPKEEPDQEKKTALAAKIQAEKDVALAQSSAGRQIVRLLDEENRRAGELKATHRARSAAWQRRPWTGPAVVEWANLTVTYLRRRRQLRQIRSLITGGFVSGSDYQPIRRPDSDQP